MVADMADVIELPVTHQVEAQKRFCLNSEPEPGDIYDHRPQFLTALDLACQWAAKAASYPPEVMDTARFCGPETGGHMLGADKLLERLELEIWACRFKLMAYRQAKHRLLTEEK